MIDIKEALAIWVHEYGNKEYAYDFTGKKIKKSDYQKNNQVGWVITHLKPLELGGEDHIGNTIIMHHRTFAERGLQFPKITIDDVEYQVMHCAKDDYYYIERVDTEDEDDGVII
jgi:hypothetical protein